MKNRVPDIGPYTSLDEDVLEIFDAHGWNVRNYEVLDGGDTLVYRVEVVGP